jgi:hypothetical protein
MRITVIPPRAGSEAIAELLAFVTGKPRGARNRRMQPRSRFRGKDKTKVLQAFLRA